jgi:hypothetical protein
MPTNSQRNKEMNRGAALDGQLLADHRPVLVPGAGTRPVILRVQLFAGFGTSGTGLSNTANQNDVLSPPRVRDLDPDQSCTSWQMPFWPHAREFFSGESMREGISFTDDDEVVTISAGN